MSEPIVSVHAGGRIDGWWRQVVDLLAPDAAVNVDVDPDLAQGVAKAIGLPYVPLDRIDLHSPASWTTHPFSLPGTDRDPPVVACSNGALWQAVAAGDVTPEQEQSLHREGLSVRRPTTADQVARASLSGTTLMDRTVSGFGEYWASGIGGQIPTIAWVCRPNGLRDCLHFWNLRALRPLNFERAPMVLLPANELPQWLEFGRQFAGLLARRDEFSPDVLLASLSVSESELQQTAKTLGLVPSTDSPRTGSRWPAPMRSEPFTYLTTRRVDPRQFFCFERRYGVTADVEAHLVAGEATLRFASPVDFKARRDVAARTRQPASV